MTARNEYSQYVLEQLAGLGQVTSLRMFGGVGLYFDGLFFGLIADDVLYFKVDDTNRADYQARGMRQFRPYADRPDVSMSYYEVPADALENDEELIVWARKSIAVALAAAKDSGRPSQNDGRRARGRKKR